MPKTYSFTTGFWKGIIGMLVFSLSMATFSGLADVSIWGLIETHLKPILGSMTVAGLITMLINWLKFRFS